MFILFLLRLIYKNKYILSCTHNNIYYKNKIILHLIVIIIKLILIIIKKIL